MIGRIGLTRRDCGVLMLLGLAVPAAAEGVAGPLALAGLDPVSYFLPSGPRAGLPRFELSARGRTWRFASEADRAAFARDPEAYAPRLGGYDVAGILAGRLVDADPRCFAVIGGRLYLFRDLGRRADILADPALSEKAEAQWPTLRKLMDGALE